MPCTFTVYRHLKPSELHDFRMGGGEPSPVLGSLSRKPLGFENLRAAVEAAERMNRGRLAVGSDYASNVVFTAGWIGEHP